MARRRRGFRLHNAKSALGGHDLATAYASLNKLEQRCATVTVPPLGHTFDEVLHWMFSEEDIAISKAAKDVVNEYPQWGPTTNHTYSLPRVAGIPCGLQITVDFDKVCIPFKKNRLLIGATTNLRETLLALYRVHNQYSLVRHVITWLDENATIGAMKYYFPSISALVKSDKLLQAGDGAIKHPEGVAQQVPLIRAALNALAQGLLLPELDKQQEVDRLSVTFEQGMNTFDNGTSFILPATSLSIRLKKA